MTALWKAIKLGSGSAARQLLDAGVSREGVLVASLFLVFVAITAPGISWGTPGFWHPDELVKIADRVLRGLTVFDTRNFDYPSLPKYVMYWLGRMVYALGYSRATFIESARFLSVLLGGVVVSCAYLLARLSGGGVGAGLLAALLLVSASEMALNARFAHNDIYLACFTSLSVLAMLLYRRSLRPGREAAARLWLYAAFLGVGLATSSKYNAISLLLAVVTVGLACEFPRWRKRPLHLVGMLLVGLALTGLGFVIGTPRAILAPTFYLPRALEALRHHAVYGVESRIGLVGQWQVFLLALGLPAFILATAGFVWAVYRAWGLRSEQDSLRREAAWSNLILLVSILALDLPILISYNYQPRFFLPAGVLLAVLSGLGMSDWLGLAGGRRWLRAGLLAACVLIITFGFLRSARIALLFLNDNRIAAGNYLAGLPTGARIEYTLYPPNLPEGRFKTFNYPLFIEKVEGVGASDKPYKFNQGEAGLEKRHPDFLVVDSFTYGRFDDPLICAGVQNECDFFRRLIAGQTAYRLARSFEYQPPSWLPDAPANFLNPVILVFQRAQP